MNLPNKNAQIEQLDAVDATNSCGVARNWTGQNIEKDASAGAAKEGQPTAVRCLFSFILLRARFLFFGLVLVALLK